ncbi:MAG TPA: GH92 family glycosyl hydrolase [Candidatus Avibacteroides faecavium]|nr:GH92 family glycosyl hydrolase [Candidatus Avibacteroides faecavium]
MNLLKPLAAAGILALWGCAQQTVEQCEAYEPVDYVNTLMGTDSKFLLSNGNTYPAVALPWGMNFWTPQTGRMGDGWAYTYASDKIRGFKQTHQPSPWINDYGQFSIMPVTGGMKIGEDERASWFSHKAETATPYYYQVYLAEHDVVAEMSPTERCAAFRFTFPESEESYVVIDAFDNGSHVEVLPDGRTVVGYTTKNSGGVPEGFKNYFVVQFDEPFASSAVWSDSVVAKGRTALTGDHVGAIVGFRTERGDKVNVKVASSFISPEQALQNLKEVEGKDFDAVKDAARDRWNDVLGRIVASDGDIDRLRTFYSCFYRSVLFPRMLHEVTADGQVMHYSPYNGQVLPGRMFTDTGFWDTFRCLFPFLNLVFPEMAEQMQEGLLNTYLESGFFPEWASPGHRGCMIGNNSASVVADAYLKGLTKVDADKMFEGLLHGANAVHPTVSSTGRLGFDYYNRLGYVPYNVGINENAARTLEYAYDDWCIYQMGKALGRPESEIAVYKERAANYKNIFNPVTNLMSGRNEDGTFPDLNPLKWGDAFTEGNAWHYSWSVFHDVAGLMELMGGKDAFVTMLDSVFSVPPVFDDSYYGFVIHEIREMQIVNMGNYAHGNQPVQHMIYLYDYAGQPWKAQNHLRDVMTRLYRPTPDGYCGDEDNGQTSAWFVFSAMGFYPVCPGTDQYVIGAPLFDHVQINLPGGKTVEINAEGNSDTNRYVSGIKVNGEEYTKNYFTYGDLTSGATIDFTMSATPDTERGIRPEDMPYSMSTAE